MHTPQVLSAGHSFTHPGKTVTIDSSIGHKLVAVHRSLLWLFFSSLFFSMAPVVHPLNLITDKFLVTAAHVLTLQQGLWLLCVHVSCLQARSMKFMLLLVVMVRSACRKRACCQSLCRAHKQLALFDVRWARAVRFEPVVVEA